MMCSLVQMERADWLTDWLGINNILILLPFLKEGNTLLDHHAAWACEIITLPGFVRSLISLGLWDYYAALVCEITNLPGFVRSSRYLGLWDNYAVFVRYYTAWVCEITTLFKWDQYTAWVCEITTLAVLVRVYPFKLLNQPIFMTICVNLTPLKVTRKWYYFVLCGE
jgi:hypothetical protein